MHGVLVVDELLVGSWAASLALTRMLSPVMLCNWLMPSFARGSGLQGTTV